MRQQRWLVICAALVAGVLAFIGSTVWIQPPVALAHAFVIGSDPVDGSTVSTAPSKVLIYFNAAISPISTVRVFSVQNGNLVDVTAGPGSIPASNPRELVTGLKNPQRLPQGSYEVQWTAVSNDDGHTTYGYIGFNVGFSSTGLSGTPTLGPSTSNNLREIRQLDPLALLAVAWDWLVLAALTFWIGILVVERLLLPGVERSSDLLPRTRKLTQPLEWLCLSALLFGEIISLILRATRLAQATNGGSFNFGSLTSMITETNYGLLWLARIVLILAACGLLYWTNHAKQETVPPEQVQLLDTRTGPLRQTSSQAIPKVQLTSANTGKTNITKERLALQDEDTTFSPQQGYTLAWLTLAGLILLTQALSRDITQISQLRISAIIMDWLYFAAQGLWFGGLAYLGYVLLPIAETERHGETLVMILRRIMPFLLIGPGVMLVSAIFLAEANISDPQQLLNDPYGRTLFIQSVILVLLVLLSLYTMFVLCRRFTRQVLLLPVVNTELPVRRTRQSVMERTGRSLKQLTLLQIWMGAAVLLCSALMAFFAAPIAFPNVTYANQSTQQTTTTTVNTQTKQIGNLSVMLQVLPGRTNTPNTVIVTLTDANDKLVSDAQVQLTTNMEVMDMGTGHATIQKGSPIYTATFDKSKAFNMAGLWNIVVQIQRPGQAAVKGTFQMMLTS